MNYIPLHVHDHLSLLDGVSKPEDIVSRIQEIDSKGCAITNHGNIASTIEFLQKMEKADLQPILGCETYICQESPTIKEQENRHLTHLPILAKEDAGWLDFVELVSESNKPDYFYHKPRLDIDALSKFTQRGNLIGFSGHLGSHMHYCISEEEELADNWLEKGINCAGHLQDIFGKGNFYLEIQLMDHIINPMQGIISEAIRKISKATGIPCIATPDAHYARQKDAELQRILLCINTKKTLNEANKPDFMLSTFFKSDKYHIPSHTEMKEYGHSDDELKNTLEVAEKCGQYNDILKSPILPEFPCPEGYDADSWLRQLCRDGWKQHIADNIPKEKHQKYVDRIKYELEVFKPLNLASYFLIVKDIVDFVKSNNCILSPGRGSVGGCLAAYLLNIIQIDPIQYDLIFERFYNAGRNTPTHVSMPDIDVDVPAGFRDKVIEYIRDKYGNDKVGQIVTFGTMKGRAAIKDVFRVYGDMTYDEMNDMTKHIPDPAKIADELQEMKEEEGESSIIKWTLENKADELRDYCYIKNGKLYGQYASRFAQAIRLEGTKTNQSRHAAGIVIGPRPLNKICPMIYDTRSKTQVVGFEMNDVESIGLIKMDILGISMLDKIMKIRDKLREGDYDDESHRKLCFS